MGDAILYDLSHPDWGTILPAVALLLLTLYWKTWFRAKRLRAIVNESSSSKESEPTRVS